ncbi:MAG: CPBP family intramembrane metalloprotease [Ignavibacteria bacterium]|nr:CPBP family intramembrane metalloprotease [Ignavibacteria bacterium]
MENNSPEINSSGTLNKKGPLSNLPPLYFIFLSLAAVFFLYQIVGGLITYFILGEDMEIKGENLNLTRLVLTFAQFMFILAPAIVLVMLQDNNLKETFRLKLPKGNLMIYSIIGLIFIQPFLQVFLYFQNELIFSLPFGQEFLNSMKEMFDTLESTTAKLVSAGSIPEFLMVVLVIAVTPAICEEFLFRGLVLKNFEKFLSASKAIFYSGLLFALFHFHPFNLIPLIILGVYLTFIVYHSGSILTAVVCHFLNNFISATAVYIYGVETFSSMGSEKSFSIEEKLQFLLLGALSLAAFIFICRIIKKHSAAGNNILVSGITHNE